MNYSFIMIAFNEEKAIKRSLLSILELDQLADYEIIVINDSSTDNTAGVLKELSSDFPQIKVFENAQNLGRGYSRKRGVNLSSGEYLAFVDADIILPNNWLSVCLKEINGFDAVGGLAVPDGDVSYVYRILNLKPTVIKHTTSITGNNGLFRRKVLDAVEYDSMMRDGEDVDISWKLARAGFKTKSIDTLICNHNEHKSFTSSLIWLYEQGVGANRLLKRFHKYRLPDFTFGGWCLILFSSLILSFKYPAVLLLPIFFSVLISSVHILNKFSFQVQDAFQFIGAVIINSTMIMAYMFGRLFSLRILATGPNE